jgi:hypothetical protein
MCTLCVSIGISLLSTCGRAVLHLRSGTVVSNHCNFYFVAGSQSIYASCMFLVTLLRKPDSLDDAVTVLARIQATTLYEARTRLVGEFPRVVGVFAQAPQASEQQRALLAAGLVAATLDSVSIEHDPTRDIAASLAFSERAVVATMRNGRVREVAYENVSLLLHGARTGVQTTTEESKVKSFHAGRAILTGGLSMRSTKTVLTTKSTEIRETFLYIREFGDSPSLAVYERGINYAFLGAALQASSLANFTTVLTRLREQCVGARYDNRMTRPVGFGVMPLCPPSMDSGLWKSDVAAALLAIG